MARTLEQTRYWTRQSRQAQPARVSMGQHMVQAEAAARAQHTHLEGLKSQGWVYDEATRTYTHPDRPGESIEL